jgi:hypothetical protein
MNIRIKGDAGIDTNNDGIVDNTTYPIGYRAFFAYKYELTEQQYADFLNTLSLTQRVNVGIAGTFITLSNGQYFSSAPNRSCGNSNSVRFYSYADWSGLRPMSILEFNKACFGPIQPVLNGGGGQYSDIITNVGSFANANSTRISSGSSYYGLMDWTGNAAETLIGLGSLSFNAINGNGVLATNGSSDVSNLPASFLSFEPADSPFTSPGFRYVRSAE